MQTDAVRVGLRVRSRVTAGAIFEPSQENCAVCMAGCSLLSDTQARYNCDKQCDLQLCQPSAAAAGLTPGAP
jgi:hypothetical protein